MLITHSKSITIADNTANTDIVRPSDWNSAHVGAITLAGNTSNQSTWSGSNFVISGGDNVTVGVSQNSIFFRGAGGGAAATLEGFDPLRVLAAEYIGGQIGQASLFFLPAAADAPFVYDRAYVPLIISLNTGSTATASLSVSIGIYSKNNSTRLTRLSSFSGSISMNLSGTVSSASFSGLRYFTFGPGASSTVNAGNYVFAFWSSTATAGANATLSNLVASNMNTALSGYVGSAANATYQFRPFQGSYGTTTNAMPDTVAATQIQGSAAVALRGVHFRFEYGTNV